MVIRVNPVRVGLGIVGELEYADRNATASSPSAGTVMDCEVLPFDVFIVIGDPVCTTVMLCSGSTIPLGLEGDDRGDVGVGKVSPGGSQAAAIRLTLRTTRTMSKLQNFICKRLEKHIKHLVYPCII